jgi:hypothetical protein
MEGMKKKRKKLKIGWAQIVFEVLLGLWTHSELSCPDQPLAEYKWVC